MDAQPTSRQRITQLLRRSYGAKHRDGEISEQLSYQNRPAAVLPSTGEHVAPLTPGMDNRFDSIVQKGVLDHRSLRHRTDDMGVSSGRDVQADRNMTSCAESGGEEAAEPSR
jgi:hypothetical protein